MIATFVTRAVFAAALSFSSYSAQGTHSSTPEIELQYHYEPSNDDSHHSTRISCLTSITLHFSSAASVASLGGAVTA